MPSELFDKCVMFIKLHVIWIIWKVYDIYKASYHLSYLTNVWYLSSFMSSELFDKCMMFIKCHTIWVIWQVYYIYKASCHLNYLTSVWYLQRRSMPGTQLNITEGTVLWKYSSIKRMFEVNHHRLHLQSCSSLFRDSGMERADLSFHKIMYW